MNTRHLVDPELLPYLDKIPPFEVSVKILPELRALSVPFVGYSDQPTDANKVVRTIPGPTGAPPLDLTVYTPSEHTLASPCIFHIHGGGYIAGRAKSYEQAHRVYASTLGCVVTSVDYRLAPETTFPGAIEDCYAALRWVFVNADELGVDSKRLGVMGESAGGGLAAALALMVRDRAEHHLAFQHLTYPMLDDRTVTTCDPHAFAGEFLWTRANNRFGWTSMLGVPPGSDQVSPYAAPARATDLSNLPPAFIATGALDLFAEEDLDYGRRLMRAGVPVEMHVYPGSFHGFDTLTDTTVAQVARRDSLAALDRFTRASVS